MSLHMITAIRRLPQLSGSLKFTALEIAHRASTSGYARVSYGYLAWKTGQSLKTMIRHVHRLISMGLLRKQTVRLTLTRYAVNAYTFLIPGITPLHKRSTPTVGQTLPEAKAEEEKSLSLREELERARKGMRFLTNPDSPMYQACVAHIARLEAMQWKE
jgi:hypothetical protein